MVNKIIYWLIVGKECEISNKVILLGSANHTRLIMRLVLYFKFLCRKFLHIC